MVIFEEDELTRTGLKKLEVVFISKNLFSLEQLNALTLDLHC